ncbi:MULTISPECIES: DUF6692 family protein [Erythrobacteraceae]|uniref:DUF6692 family protein n=1 Tax=Erythrobacteraceae TaxID=335929 RepID=UPI0020375B92|nr:DUF6692 family protein [Pelagerythrobacter marinus]USA38933.1 hypothetical protein NCF86_11550 [Pelagerythrobacter marinus]WPZ06984.1 DUF6692 family protein [Pelagerythrobacter marinus]
MKNWSVFAVGVAIALSGCNQNTAIGNDREAQLDPAPTPVPIEPASQALQNVATAIVKPETMSDADIQAIGGTAGRCVYRLTEVGFPTFVYQPDSEAFIKLNGKIIPLSADGPDRFTSGELLVTTRLIDEEGNAGLQAQEIIVVPPGAKDELGYRGYVRCDDA